MTTSVFEFLSGFFGQIWRFFNSWNIPGTNLTPAEAFIFFFVAWFVVRLFRVLFDVDFSDSNSKGK